MYSLSLKRTMMFFGAAFATHKKTRDGGLFGDQMADEVRFELTEGVNPRQFSRLLQSTTLPLIRIDICIKNQLVALIS